MWPFGKRKNDSRDKYRIVNCSDIADWRIITEVFIRNPFSGLTMRVNGLWDTGAKCSSVSSDLIERLGLIAHPDKSILVNTTNGIKASSIYDAIFIFGEEQISVSTFEVNNPIPAISVIIGMDVISKGDFRITNTGGKTEIIFRLPPQGHISK